MRRLSVGVVGGSIAGTATAALLARSGHRVTVFERSAGLQDRGGGISLALPALEELRARGLIGERLAQVRPTSRAWRVKDAARPLGRTIAHQPVSAAALHWGLLHRALLEQLDGTSYRGGTAIERVQGRVDGASVVTATGEEHAFDLLVGADGYGSRVRAEHFLEHVPRPAGYALWRGILDEAAVADPERADEEIHTVGTVGGHALFYLVPGREGRTGPGHRRLNWVWYDTEVRTGEARDPGAADAGRRSTGAVAPGAMPEHQRRHLDARAHEQLPPWYRDVVRATPAPSVQELFDLAPDRYADGRICLVGDAASIGRPHTASATLKALEDAVALAAALDEEPSVDAALERYGRLRVPAGRRLVELGRTLGRQQVTEAPDWSALDEARFEEWFRTGRTSTAWFATDAE